MPPVPSRTVKLFRTSKAELQRLAKLEKAILPKKIWPESALRGKDSAREFKVTDVAKAKGMCRAFILYPPLISTKKRPNHNLEFYHHNKYSYLWYGFLKPLLSLTKFGRS